MRPRETARYMAALALALSFAPSLMRRRRREQIAISVTAAGLGAAAGWASETVVAQLARRVEGGETAARLSLAAAGAAAALLRLDGRRPALALVGTSARVAGIAAMVGWAAPERRRVSGFDPLPLAAAGALAAGVMAVRADRRRRARRPIDFPCDAYLPTTSHDLPGLDFEGQRFCAGAVGGLPVDPVRVFVGVRSASGVAARCELAVAELERLGGFERARLVVCSPTLRGYVNPVPLAAEERLSGGDVAHVCVQYHDRRTPFLWRKVPIAAQTHRELLARLAHRDGPELCVSGESLGAWASQQVFRDDGVPGLERRGVQRALWVGTPYFSRFARRLKEGSHPAVEWLRTREILEADPPHAERLRYVFLERLSDPVVLFPGIELLWRRPPWRGERGEISWKPGISFLHGLLDLVKATAWTRDQPASEGHDYRIELPLAVNVAFGHLVPRERAAAVGQQVLAEEAERAQRIRAARRQAAGDGAPTALRGSRRRRRSRSRS
jgi:uncharacterized membrane protein